MRSREAYTLLEVMIVLVLLAVVAGAAIPAYLSGKTVSAERRAANALSELLLRTRLKARESGSATSLVLSPANGRFWLKTPDSTLVGNIALSDGLHFDETLPLRVECGFQPSGSATPCTIRIRTVVVRVDQWTGNIRVDEDRAK